MGSARFNEQNYYEILEIEPGAAQNEIHLAYQKAKNTYSPDSPALFTMFSEDEAKELLELIEEAFETLSNQARRKKYDASLATVRGGGSELPDLEIRIQESTSHSSTHQSSKPSSDRNSPTMRIISHRESIPDGFAKTKFSVYEIDDAFEEEIANPHIVDGPLLQKIRLYKQINLEQISNETKISKSYLSALEADDYDGLPAGVFVRGFVVQVARILGMDEQKTATMYMNKFKAQSGK